MEIWRLPSDELWPDPPHQAAACGRMAALALSVSANAYSNPVFPPMSL
jgi:hypothetical protein